jgi:hypothetical protein
MNYAMLMRLIRQIHFEPRRIWELSSIVDKYAVQPIQPVTLTHLVRLGKANSVLESGQLVHSELPRRLARRVQGIVTQTLIPSITQPADDRRY